MSQTGFAKQILTNEIGHDTTRRRSLILYVCSGRRARAEGFCGRQDQTAAIASADRSCRCIAALPLRQSFSLRSAYNGNDYLGNDPDPFIRLMIQRDLGAKYGGEM